jgi:hypothetical protein
MKCIADIDQKGKNMGIANPWTANHHTKFCALILDIYKSWFFFTQDIPRWIKELIIYQGEKESAPLPATTNTKIYAVGKW